MPLASDLINEAWGILAQATNSPAAALPTGTGQDLYTITSDAQCLLWLTEGQNRITRLAVPIVDSATYQSSAGDVTLAPFTDIVSTTGRSLYQPDNVYIGGKQLIPANYGYLNSGFYKNDPATGNPTAWANANSAILLPNGYTTQPTFTITGFFLPSTLPTDSTAIDAGLDDFACLCASHYLAWKIAQKNADNTVIGPRVATLYADWANGVKEIWTRLVQNDSSFEGYFAEESITGIIQLINNKTVKN